MAVSAEHVRQRAAHASKAAPRAARRGAGCLPWCEAPRSRLHEAKLRHLVRPRLSSRARRRDVEFLPAARIESIQLEAARQRVFDAHDGARLARTPVSSGLRRQRLVVRRSARCLAVSHVQRIRRRFELLRPCSRGNNPQERVDVLPRNTHLRQLFFGTSVRFIANIDDPTPSRSFWRRDYIKDRFIPALRRNRGLRQLSIDEDGSDYVQYTAKDMEEVDIDDCDEDDLVCMALQEAVLRARPRVQPATRKCWLQPALVPATGSAPTAAGPRSPEQRSALSRPQTDRQQTRM